MQYGGASVPPPAGSTRAGARAMNLMTHCTISYSRSRFETAAKLDHQLQVVRIDRRGDGARRRQDKALHVVPRRFEDLRDITAHFVAVSAQQRIHRVNVSFD